MTKQQRLQQRLDMMVACIMVYHPNKLSQAQVGDLFGISHQAVSKTLRRVGGDDPDVKRMAFDLGWLNPQPFERKRGARVRCGDTIIDNRDLPYDTPLYRKVEPQAADELSQAVEDYNRAIRRRRRNGRSENRHSR